MSYAGVLVEPISFQRTELGILIEPSSTRNLRLWRKELEEFQRVLPCVSQKMSCSGLCE